MTSLGEIALASFLAIAIALVLLGGVMVWFQPRGDAELRGLRREREQNEREAEKAALEASEVVASASALGRTVRHARRRIEAEQRRATYITDLHVLATVGVGGGAAPAEVIPPPPPPPP